MPRYCPRCRGIMHPRRLEKKERWVCRDCKFIQYRDMAVAVSAIVYDGAGRVLLVRRAIEPGYGKWVIPGGWAESGEGLEQAAVRETTEEVDLDLGPPSLAGVYAPGGSVATVVYAIPAHHPKARDAGMESLTSRFFAPAQIPWEHVYFDSTRTAIKDWLNKTVDTSSEV